MKSILAAIAIAALASPAQALVVREPLTSINPGQVYMEWDDSAGTTKNPNIRIFSVGLAGCTVHLELYKCTECLMPTLVREWQGPFAEDINVTLPANTRLVRQTQGVIFNKISKARIEEGLDSIALSERFRRIVFDDNSYLTTDLFMNAVIFYTPECPAP